MFPFQYYEGSDILPQTGETGPKEEEGSISHWEKRYRRLTKSPSQRQLEVFQETARKVTDVKRQQQARYRCRGNLRPCHVPTDASIYAQALKSASEKIQHLESVPVEPQGPAVVDVKVDGKTFSNNIWGVSYALQPFIV